MWGTLHKDPSKLGPRRACPGVEIGQMAIRIFRLFYVAKIKQKLFAKLSPSGSPPLQHGTERRFCDTSFGRRQQCGASRQSRRLPRVPQLSPRDTMGLEGSCGPPFYHAYRYVAGRVQRSVTCGSNWRRVHFRDPPNRCLWIVC